MRQYLLIVLIAVVAPVSCEQSAFGENSKGLYIGVKAVDAAARCSERVSELISEDDLNLLAGSSVFDLIKKHPELIEVIDVSAMKGCEALAFPNIKTLPENTPIAWTGTYDRRAWVQDPSRLKEMGGYYMFRSAHGGRHICNGVNDQHPELYPDLDWRKHFTQIPGSGLILGDDGIFRKVIRSRE